MSGRGPRFSEDELRVAIAASRSWAEALRMLGYRSAGGNWRTLKKYAELWGISTGHFDPNEVRRTTLRRANRPIPLEKVMVENSTYSRAALKRRLFAEGIKERRCETCGQGESWHGSRMALILDHINGIPNDHRLENLRILCPNCAATLSTHCGAKNRRRREPRACAQCGESFLPTRRSQLYCSTTCAPKRWTGRERPELRKVERPPFHELLGAIEASSRTAVGRGYGVSGNTITSWLRAYEAAIATQVAEGSASFEDVVWLKLNHHPEVRRARVIPYAAVRQG